uniref:CHCH domain-containing protein n=1 Tax=Oryza nivara TaxID=4536 RepID=A0A0E0I492_ORYNI
MGQGLSQPAQAVEEPSPPAVEAAPSSSPSPAPAPSSLEALAAEAMSFDEDGNESIDVKVQKALDCPCVAELKNGPCGSQFVDAFSCFLKSTEEEKISDNFQLIWAFRLKPCHCRKCVCVSFYYTNIKSSLKLFVDLIEHKGSDCVKPFITLQDCIKINPEAFSKEILEEEENDEEAEKSNLKVRAPAWSRESKPKL